MHTSLLNVYVIENKRTSLRHFLMPYGWTQLNLPEGRNFDINKLIKTFNLKEISLNDILQAKYQYNDVCPPLLKSDIDFDNAGYSISHYICDENGGPYDLLYGTEPQYFNGTPKHISLSQLVPKKTYTYPKGDTLYGVIHVGDMDDEIDDDIVLFDSEKDALDCIGNYQKGEIAPYIYLNMDYNQALEDYQGINNLPHIDWNRINNQSGSVVIMPQIIFIGTDYYN